MEPRERLADLVAKATALNGIKDYGAAAEVYSEAAELQTEINGEMSPENADLLYAYGRCLFFVAQKTSTVLGGTAAQAQLSKEEKRTSKKRKADGAAIGNGKTGGEGVESSQTAAISTSAPADVVPDEATEIASKPSAGDEKPFFQFTGDDHYDDSDEDDDDDGEGEEEQEEDDFETSFELLDLARILYSRKLESTQDTSKQTSDKGKGTVAVELSSMIRDLKSRIADIYDLQAEISLESEKFAAAVDDLRSCLALKEELEPPESNILAECHYKLSLSLEVAAQEQQRDEDGNPFGDITIDWEMRNEAIEQQEKAIRCCELRMAQEKSIRETLADEAEKTKAQEQIDDVEEMVSDMRDRLAELKKPPVSVKSEAESQFNKEMMAGILGQIMGGSTSKEQQKAELAKVIAGANDLSGMVKKKSKKASTAISETASNASTSGKRKADFNDDIASEKKAKVEDAEDSGL